MLIVFSVQAVYPFSMGNLCLKQLMLRLGHVPVALFWCKILAFLQHQAL